mgnify:FL=1
MKVKLCATLCLAMPAPQRLKVHHITAAYCGPDDAPVGVAPGGSLEELVNTFLATLAVADIVSVQSHMLLPLATGSYMAVILYKA